MSELHVTPGLAVTVAAAEGSASFSLRPSPSTPQVQMAELVILTKQGAAEYPAVVQLWVDNFGSVKVRVVESATLTAEVVTS